MTCPRLEFGVPACFWFVLLFVFLFVMKSLMWHFEELRVRKGTDCFVCLVSICLETSSYRSAMNRLWFYLGHDVAVNFSDMCQLALHVL